MNELIIPKPAVAVTVQALNAGLPGVGYSNVHISSKRPGAPTGDTILPNRFIRVTRAGGGMINRVTDEARLLIECWSDDSADCEEFANAARGVIYASRGQKHGGGFIRHVERHDDGPVDHPDPLFPGHERYQFRVGVLVSTN